jgi:aryl-alcohol dehydrogenase-like predicted oxidoreductase
VENPRPEGKLEADLDQSISLIDTADAYCLDDRDFNHDQRLPVTALEGQKGVLIATKCGCRRPGGAWTVDARPEALGQAAHASLDAMRTDHIDLLQLHAPDSRVRFEQSVGALARLREAGKVRLIGLSNVSASQIEKARRSVPIASVQNRWNPMSRGREHDGVLSRARNTASRFCRIRHSAVDLGRRCPPRLASSQKKARRGRMSPHRLVLAWTLAKSAAVIPIPSARRPESIRDSASARTVTLTASDLTQVEAAFS